MEKSNTIKYVIPILSVTLLLIIGSNFYVYDKLSNDYTNKITSLNQKIDSLENELKQDVEKEKLARQEQLNNLDTKTSDIKKSLESQVNDVSGSIEEVKSNTEENLANINNKIGGVEKKNSLLESKLSEIQVSSSDFSSIIEDVVKAVASVRTNLGQGSGVLFNSNGYIITNNHVIDGASEITVIDYNGNSYNAVIVDRDVNADLAVLKINGSSFSYLNFEDSSNINIGDRVIAVGNPLGLSFSVTEGIVSGLNRQIDNSGIGYIQTDVPINPGNYGGPLVNSAKKIVGITTLKFLNTEGLGFAIPANVVENFANSALG